MSKNFHTLDEVCRELSIPTGSRSRAVKCFERDYGIIGAPRMVYGHNHKVLTYTHDDFLIIVARYSVRDKKGGRQKRKAVVIQTADDKLKAIDDVKCVSNGSKSSTGNREKGYYMTINPFFMINSFQGRVI